MPKKTAEEVREKVVALRKGGATYTQIEAQVMSPETGQKLARPTLIKILREAGLTKGSAVLVVAPTTAPPSSALTPSGTPSMPAPASSNGVDDFMPKGKPKTEPKGAVEFECDNCGTEFIGEEGDQPPETCPECGA